MKHVAALILLLVLTATASAKVMYFGLIEMAEQSDTAVRGTVTAVAGEETATIAVTETLLGKVDGKTLEVGPPTNATCFGPTASMKVGDEVVIMGKVVEGKPLAIAGFGQGTFKLLPESKETTLPAVQTALKIAAIKDEHERLLAALAEAKSTNPILQPAVRTYLSHHLSTEANRGKFNAELIAMLQDPDPAVQQMAMDNLRFARANEAVPRMIELTQSKDPRVVQAASNALSSYDTPETAAALIELTHSANPTIRTRACLDLGNIRQPGVKDAQAALLKDKDDSVRAIAPVGLIYLLRAGKADDQIPQLAAMVSDPAAPVRAAAANALGEAENRDAIAPLLAAIKPGSLDRELQIRALDAIYKHYQRGAEATALIDPHIDVIIESLKKDDSTESFGPAFRAMGTLSICKLPAATDALKWAAESHPSQEVRGYAQRSLADRK